MSAWDPEAFANGLIADMRSHGGAVTSGPLAGHPLAIMMTTGAKSGQARRSIVTFSRDGGDYLIAGTNSGGPTDPAWVANIRANPSVTLEAEGNPPIQAKATVVDGAERDRLWAQHVAALPHFADYPKTSGRVIPVVRLTVG